MNIFRFGNLRAKVCALVAALPLLLAILVAALAIGLMSGCATAFRDDSHYVALAPGPGTGYFLVRPDSELRDQLRLTYAPTSDTGSPLHRGHGADVLAFRFNPRGVLIVSPAYICQLRPDPSIIHRFRGLKIGRSTLPEVERLFGRVHTVIRKPDGLLVYYTLQVYNPLEESPGAGFR